MPVSKEGNLKDEFAPLPYEHRMIGAYYNTFLGDICLESHTNLTNDQLSGLFCNNLVIIHKSESKFTSEKKIVDISVV